MADRTATPLCEFLTELLQEGRAIVRGDLHVTPPDRNDLERVGALLEEVGRAAAADAPGRAPALDLPVALWAAESFAWACGMLVDRSQTDVSLPKRITKQMPAATSASHHWSADLVFRFASDLVKRCQKIGDDDPLFPELVKLFSPWPLACVGSSVQPRQASLDVVMADDCLRTMLVDRIIVRRDTALADTPSLARSIRYALGGLERTSI